jgi:3-oxoacyl-[acyl-carrier protein] reductase
MTNKVNVITGAATGLGLALTKHLVSLGQYVAIFDIDDGRMDEIAAELGGQVSVHKVDVTDMTSVQTAVAEVMKKHHQIDTLVNAAGITGITGVKSHDLRIDNFEKVFRINVYGCMHTYQAIIPHMLVRNYGRVLHIASIAGKEGNAGMVAYSSSKAAVIGMTKVQGKELAETGITVNALAPAVIYTDLVAAMPEKQVAYMTEKIPMRRCGTLQEFAEMAAFIISPSNSFSTAFTYDLSGGRATY